MTVNEIKLVAYEAIELLQSAEAGKSDAITRCQRREQAGRLLASLPSKWWKRLSPQDSDMISQSLIDVA